MINLISVIVLLVCISLMTAMVRESVKKDTSNHHH